MSLTQGPGGPWGAEHQCDIVAWRDSIGKMRTAWLVQADGVYSNLYTGGFITRLLYSNTVDVVDAQELWHSNLSGLGSLVNHYTTTNSRNWIQSKTDAATRTNTVVFLGAHHLIWRAVFDEYADQEQPAKGAWRVTVDYMFRTGDDAFLYAITYDTSAFEPGTLDHDSRSPYSEFAWDGDVNFLNGITGFRWGRDKLFICSNVAAGAWTYAESNRVPFVWEWKSYPDREIGFVQTQSQQQRTGGKEVLHGASGSSLPSYWQMGYQMNGSPAGDPFNYQHKKITWGTPIGAIQGGHGSPDGYLNYSLLVQMGPWTRGGVTSLLGQAERIHGGLTRLSASDGTVVTQGLDGVACPVPRAYSPAGYDHNYHAWRARTSTTNTARLHLDLDGGPLRNPTFVIEDYRGTGMPSTVQWNGTNLAADTGYYASLDHPRRQLYLTFNGWFAGSNTVRIAGSYATNRPGVPTGLAADNGTPGINVLTWADETSYTGESYRVYRSASVITNLEGLAPLAQEIPAGAQRYEHVVESTGPHYYALAAESEYHLVNETIIAGANATTSSADNVDITPPSAPGRFRAALTNAKVLLTWDPPQDADLAGYRIERGVTSNAFTVVTNLPSGGAGFLHAGLVPGLAYYFRMAAVDDETPPNVSTATPVRSVRYEIAPDLIVYDGEPTGRPLVPARTGAWGGMTIGETNTLPYRGERHMVLAVTSNGSAWWAWNAGWAYTNASTANYLTFFVRTQTGHGNDLRLKFGRSDGRASTVVPIAPAYLADVDDRYRGVSIPLSAFLETNSPTPYDFSAVNQIVFLDSGTNAATYWLDDLRFAGARLQQDGRPLVTNVTVTPSALNESNDATEVQLLAWISDPSGALFAVLGNLTNAGGPAAAVLLDNGVEDDGVESNRVFGTRFRLSRVATAVPGFKRLAVTALDAGDQYDTEETAVQVRRITTPAARLLYDGEQFSKPLSSGGKWTWQASLAETNLQPYTGLGHMIIGFSNGFGSAGYAFNTSYTNLNAAWHTGIEFYGRLASAGTNDLGLRFARTGGGSSTRAAIAPEHLAGFTTAYRRVAVPFSAFSETNGAAVYDFSAVSQLIFEERGNSNVTYYVDDIRFYAEALPDADGDGLPDLVETGDGVYINAYTTGTRPDDPDTDGDSQGDGDEVRAGMNPLDSNSFFRVSGARWSPLSVLAWPSAEGRRYRLAITTNLFAGPWLPVATNIPAVPPLNVHTTEPPAGPGPWLYRILVE